ncbi:DUF4192 domain-containing protein [Pseudonocardia nigra]|uniref:DUF4192 domain-containing protein n=1 Tax=Pseudonocardia nigra TaxID=1921578 RepID=UPI001C604F52|nr:DUF4192 domain-containing protein [Pseudonocardia nigra]
MASPDLPRSVDRGADTVTVRNPGELIAAIPAVMGFRPRESLVVLALGGAAGRTLGLTLRADLPPPEHAADVADTVVRTVLRDRPAGAAVIVVAGRTGADPPHAALVDLVVRGLQRQDVPVPTVMWVESITGGTRWACYGPCGCTGVLPDPASTAYVAAAVASGTVVRDDRGDLERMVAPADPERIRRREELLVRAVDELVARHVLDIGPDGDGAAHEAVAGADGTAVAVVDTAIVEASAGRLDLDDERVVSLAIALGDPAVRDVALLRCAGPAPLAAERLWTALVRETPDPEAAEPAALLAVSALLRGDGALANVAIDRAERAWPGHRLAGMLSALVATGPHPDEVREWVRSGSEVPGPGGRRSGGEGLR